METPAGRDGATVGVGSSEVSLRPGIRPSITAAESQRAPELQEFFKPRSESASAKSDIGAYNVVREHRPRSPSHCGRNQHFPARRVLSDPVRIWSYSVSDGIGGSGGWSRLASPDIVGSR